MNNKLFSCIRAYESGSNDLKTLNKWLRDDGWKLIAKNGKIIQIKIIAA